MNPNEIKLLESGAATPKGAVSLLCEMFSGDIRITDDPFKVERRVNESGETELIETRIKDGPLKIAGTFQCEGLRNANKRVYKLGLWEKHVKPGSPLMVKIQERRCIGEIEHPQNGVGHLRNTAILMTGLSMDKPGADGTRRVLGEAEITDTPDGRIVRDLLRSGVRIGVSSRATGVVDENGMVEEASFNPITWDVVANPSTPGAYPNVVKESVENLPNADESAPSRIKSFVCENGDLRWQVIDPQGRVVRQVQLVTENTAFSGDTNMASPKDRLKELTNQYQAHAVLSESASVDRKHLDNVLLDLSSTVAALVKEDGTLASAADFLQGQISETRKKLAAPVVEKKKCDDDEDGDDDDDKKMKMKKDEASDEDTDGVEVSEDDDMTELEYVQGLLAAANEELKAKDEVIGSLTEALEQQEKELEEALASADAAAKTLAEMTAANDPKAKALKDAIETSIRENANLEPLRAILESQTDINEVKKIADAVTKPAAKVVSETRKDLPGKDVKSTNESQSADPAATVKDPNKPKVFSIVESIANKRANILGGALRTAASDRR